jgi:uncharacterized protein (TIGR00661 family)
MKIMIFVCGEGLGHTSRCISLGRELKAAGHDVHFGAYGYSKELIGKKGYTTHKIPSEVTLVGKAGTLNLRKSVFATFKRGQFLGLLKLARILRRIRPDVVISDSYYMGILSAKARKIPCYLVLNQSNMEQFFVQKGTSGRIVGDIIRRFYTGVFRMTDGILIPDFPMPHTICRKNLDFTGDIWKKVLYTGPLIGKKYVEVERLDLKRPHILSTLGGFGYREPIFRKVIQAAQLDSKIHYTLLSGPFIDIDAFKLLPENVRMLEFIEDQFPFLASCDIIIAPGGHSTMMEAMSFGIPMLSVPDINHSEQHNNAFAIDEDSLGKMIEYSTSAKDILADIHELLCDDKYRKNVLKLRKLAEKYEGTTFILKLLESKHSVRRGREINTKGYFVLSRLRGKTSAKRMQKKRS